MNETITISMDEYVKSIENQVKINVLKDMVSHGEPDYRVMEMFEALYGLEKR